jgi:hypothetical protein
LGHHCRNDQIGDAGCRLARAEEQDSLVNEFSAGNTQRREDPGERDRRRTLDVVVEGGQAIAILVEQPERVLGGKILELDDHSREYFLGGGNELLHQLLVSAAARAALAQPDVVGVGK